MSDTLWKTVLLGIKADFETALKRKFVGSCSTLPVGREKQLVMKLYTERFL